MFEVAFLLEITIMNYRFCHQKQCLRGRNTKSETKIQICLVIQESKRQEPLHVCAFPCGRMRKSLFLLTSLHPFYCFTQASLTIHVLFIFMTNINYYKYFTTPTISFPSYFFNFCFLYTKNFCLFVCYLRGAVVYTL